MSPDQPVVVAAPVVVEPALDDLSPTPAVAHVGHSHVEERVRLRLLERREQLAALASERREKRLADLLRRVDSTLASIDVGEWGVCRQCHGQMNEARLEEDPLVSVCLECLSSEERRSLERDLETAAKVQRALLPPAQLVHHGWELAYLWEPRGPVSGDHVDLVRPECAEEPLHLLLGDVVGKGVAASFLQAHLHALFRALTGWGAPPSALHELLGRANRLFSGSIGGVGYATMVAGRLHPDGRVELANAGHPRPLLADRRGVRPVEGASLPLGLFAETAYTGRELLLDQGDTLLLYTDGFTEAGMGGESGQDEEYGIGRAAAALRRGRDKALPDLLASLREDMRSFLAGTPRQDDLTLLALRRTAPATV